MITIWCDESGQTFNKLFDEYELQPHYAYSAVALEVGKATEIVNTATKDFKIQGEIKVVNLAKHTKGQKAISWVIRQCVDEARVSIHDKKYALACKFFEQMFEPIIANQSSAMYYIGFNKFISHLLYREFYDDAVKLLLLGFQSVLMTEDKVHALSEYIETIGRQKFNHPDIRNVTSIIQQNSKKILSDVGRLQTLTLGRWVLDLTSTSLHCLLSHWGTQNEKLRVYYDSSLPLKENAEFFGWSNANYDIAEIQAVTSKSTPGIQVAEVFAGAATYALKNRESEVSRGWLELLRPCILGNCSVGSDPSSHGKDSHSRRCAAILGELAVRSAAGSDLFANLQIDSSTRYNNMVNTLIPSNGSLRNRRCPCGSGRKSKDCHIDWY